MNVIDELRTNRQYASVNKWMHSQWNGTINATRRFGKTRLAQIAIETLKVQRPNAHIRVISPNTVVKQNNETALNYGECCKHMTIFELMHCIDDVLPYHIDLYIFDEVHNYLNGQSLNVLNKAVASCRMGLTGSTLTQVQTQILENLRMPIVDIITEEEALKNKWISNFVEYNLPVQFNAKDKERYRKHTEIIKDKLKVYRGLYRKVNGIFKFAVLDSDFDMLKSCKMGKYAVDPKTQHKFFIKPNIFRNILADIQGWTPDVDLTTEYGIERNKYWNPENIRTAAIDFMRCVENRNMILVHNENKIDMVETIIKTFNKPTIVFNEVTAMADDCAYRFGKEAISYHSNVETQPRINPETGEYFVLKNGNLKNIGKTALLKIVVENMRKGYYKYLFCAKALNEGLTIENIELVITTGGNTNPSVHEQRTSRGKTYDYSNPNKTCVIVNLYCDDFTITEEVDGETVEIEVKSRDKAKLILRQVTSQTEPIWIDDVSEIEC